MIGRLKKTVKHTAIYGFGNISNKLVGLLLLPLYTDYLSTSEYGILSIIEITSSLLIILFTINLPQSMLLWCSREKSLDKEKSIIFTTTIGIIVIAATVVISFYPFHTELSGLVFGNEKFTNYFSLLMIWFFFGILNRIPQSLIRLRERSVFFSVVMSTKFTLILLVNIYLVAFVHMGVEGIVIGQILGEIYSLILTIPILYRNIRLSVEWKALKEMLVYGIPLIFTAVSSQLLSSGDRYIMLYFLTSSSVGIYAIAQKIGGVINVFLLNSFQQGFMPIAFKMFDQENSKRFFSKVLTYYTFILALTALFVSFFSKEVVYLLADHSYYQSYTVVPFVAFAFLVKGINSVFTLSYHYSKKTTGYAIIIVVGMLLNIGMNILMIPWFGMYGAGISMLSSYIFMAVLSYKHAQKLYFIEYEIAKVIKIVVLSTVLYLITLYLPDTDNFIEVILKLALFMSFPFILFFLNFYDKIELIKLKQSWDKWKNPKRWAANIKNMKF